LVKLPTFSVKLHAFAIFRNNHHLSISAVVVLGCHLGITWHQEEEEAHLSVMGSGILLILCTLVVAGGALKFWGSGASRIAVGHG